MQPAPDVSIVIPTRNRSSDLRRSLASIYRQEGTFEVIVVDDASEDDTCEMIRREFPQVQIIENSEPRGVVVRRNQGAEHAVAPIMLSIDDDAEFMTNTGIVDAISALQHPRVGAVSFPIQNIVKGTYRPVQLKPPDDGQLWCTAQFIGAGYAVWRKLFREIGGYDTAIYYGEEEVFCRRLIHAGYVVHVANVAPIHHYPHSGNWRQTDRSYLGYRNRVVCTTITTPLHAVPFGWIQTCGRSVYGIARSRSISHSKKILVSLATGMMDAVRFRKRRTPMNLRSYRVYRRLRRQRMVPLSAIEHQLPEPAYGPASDLRIS